MCILTSVDLHIGSSFSPRGVGDEAITGVPELFGGKIEVFESDVWEDVEDETREDEMRLDVTVSMNRDIDVNAMWDPCRR